MQVDVVSAARIAAAAAQTGDPMTPDDASGATDEAAVDQHTGEAAGAAGTGGNTGDTGDTGGADDTGGGREVGVTAAVERDPAETSSAADPVPDHRHASLQDREPARSTDDL
jgi:hypothetical protein